MSPALDDIVDRMTFRELLTMVKHKDKRVEVVELDFGRAVGIRWTRAVRMPYDEFKLLMAERNLMA